MSQQTREVFYSIGSISGVTALILILLMIVGTIHPGI